MHYVHFGKDRYHLIREMEQWCREYVGPGGWWDNPDYLWIMDSMFGNTRFAFKNEKHYTWFILRWTL